MYSGDEGSAKGRKGLLLNAVKCLPFLLRKSWFSYKSPAQSSLNTMHSISKAFRLLRLISRELLRKKLNCLVSKKLCGLRSWITFFYPSQYAFLLVLRTSVL
jgi:hypothetical protein